MSEAKKEIKGLELLRVPFAKHQTSKLPKPTKFQSDEVKNNVGAGIRCEECGGWHHPKVVHLDYVGHAALTDRLLDCDINWNWEPVAVDSDGAPKLDSNGGLWIRLTISGVTRMGYGHSDGKTGGNALKETIGDALRNAAMRFGAALDLWHKGDLHLSDETTTEPIDEKKPAAESNDKPSYYVFTEGPNKGKKFEDMLPEDLDMLLSRYKDLKTKTPSVQTIIKKIELFKSEAKNGN